MTMKPFYKVSLLFPIAFAVLGISFSGSSNAQVLEVYSQQTKKQIAVDLNLLRSGNPKQAFKFFRGFYWEFKDKPEAKDVVRQAGQAIAQNAAVGTVVEDELGKIPNDFYTSGERAAYLIILGGIPSSWSVRILGKYLMDPTPMKPAHGIEDYSGTSNQVLAIWGLSTLGFPDAPTPGKDPELEYRENTLSQWRKWWTENEPRLDERIREINPKYQSRFQVPEVSPH